MNNEEKILAILEKHGEMLEKQGQILEQHSELLEKHSKLLEKIDLDVTGIKIRLDMEIEKKLELLAEGHETLLETLSPKSRVDALEDEMVFMKSVVKALSQEVAELKKAQ